MAEIRNALAAGKEVTVHASPVTGADGWAAVMSSPTPERGRGRIKLRVVSTVVVCHGIEIGAGFGAMLDGLLAHYRASGSMFPPDSQTAFAEFGKVTGGILSVVSLIIDVGNTVFDSGTNTPQKIVKIIGAAATAVAGSMIGASVGAFFASPVVAVIAAMILVVLAAILIDLLVNWIVGALAAFRLIRYRITYAT